MMAWSNLHKSSFDSFNNFNLFFILANSTFVYRAEDITTSLWSPVMKTLPSETVLFTRVDEEMSGEATKIRSRQKRIDLVVNIATERAEVC